MEALGGRVPQGDPADAHPPRPCGRDRRAVVRRYPASCRSPSTSAGAPHVVDPVQAASQSATRLYGDRHGARCGGASSPVPAASVHALKGGERLDVAGATTALSASPTRPGHAHAPRQLPRDDARHACTPATSAGDADRAGAPRRAADARRRTSIWTSGARSLEHDRGVGAGTHRDHALRDLRRSALAHIPTARGA